MKDQLGRTIDYLRISLTDRCNLRCVYCMPATGVPSLPHENILRIEEIERAVKAATKLGVKRIRLTGGEPLVRKGVIDLIEYCHSLPEIEDIALTTNGILLPAMADDLKRAGLNRVNISLDSLDADQFHAITRCGQLEDTLKGIDAALEAGFDPVKINTVVVRQLNQNLLSFAKLTLNRPLTVRFIEYMPVGHGTGHSLDDSGCTWGRADVVPAQEMIDTLSAAAEAEGLGTLSPIEVSRSFGAGPARYFTLPNAQGSLGFISAVSHSFCTTCNRLRLTSDGKIRTCLFSDDEYSIREALRTGTEDDVLAVIQDALHHKPESHHNRIGTQRMMSQVGG